MAEQNWPRPLTLSLLCRPQERGQLETIFKILPQHPSDLGPRPRSGDL